MKNVEIIDGAFCYDVNWMDEITEKYAHASERFFWEFIHKGYEHGERFKDFCRSLKIEGKNIGELQKIFYQSLELMKNVLIFIPETHPLAKAVENKVKEFLTQKNVVDDSFNDVLIAVSLPQKLNSPALEVEELKKMKMSQDSHPNFDLDKALNEHCRKYAFLGYREPFSSGYTKEFFVQRLNELDGDNTKSQNILETPTFSKAEQVWVDLLKEFVYFRNYRSEKLYEGLFYLEKLWDKMFKIYSLSDHAFGSYLLGEVASLFSRGEKVPEKIITERKNGHGFLLHDNNSFFITGKELHQKKVSTSPRGKVTGLQGMGACKGIARGAVKIVLKASEQNKVKDGDILVTSMTTPDFLPSMKRASAFITDEGGITCHAAIVAREMNKPCIIGTKDATQVFTDGELVEVDANQGFVRVLK